MEPEVSLRDPRQMETSWHISIIPLYMAIGSPGLLATLVALELGANVTEIGEMTAAGAVATVIFSIFWGRLSDFSGTRKRYLLIFAFLLVPVFILLSLANSVQQVILIYTAASVITAGVAPVAVMYTVECCRLEDWQVGVARYSSVTSVGNIIGLLIYSAAAPFFETHWLFYISASTCLFSFVLLITLGQEPEVALERHNFPVKSFHDAERLLSPKPLLHYLDPKRARPSINVKRLAPLQLLFLAAFIHWTGISLFGVGQIPLLNSMGLPDSLILAINVVTGITAAISFTYIAPRFKTGGKTFLKLIVIARCFLILCWAAMPLFLPQSLSATFLVPLIVSIAFNVLYAMIWLPITNFAISEAPQDKRGSVQGELLSATALAGALGSALGGVLIFQLGYSAGFIIASFIALSTIPILSRIDLASQK